MDATKKLTKKAPKNGENKFLWYSKSDWVFIAIDIIILSVFFVVIIYPLLYVLMSSVSAGNVLSLSLIPKRISWDGYTSVFAYPFTWGSIGNAVLYTVVGTSLAMIVTILCAYALAQDFPFGRFCMTLCLITMYFGGGLIPTYILMSKLGFVNSRWVMLIPGALSVYNMILVRTYLSGSIPGELLEASQIDGCSDTGFFFKILLPLSKPIIAVITLYYAVGHWNAYFNAMIYLNDVDKCPLQLILREILLASQISLDDMVDVEAMVAKQGLADILKYALIVVATAPILCVYPFIQRYFIKGVMIGSVKG